MVGRDAGQRLFKLGAVLLIASPLLAATAHAKSRHLPHGGTAHASLARNAHRGAVTFASFHGHKHLLKGGKAQYASGYGGLQCVPFARAASGIELKGNAANWWDAAEGVYERGSRPEPGSVLNFRSTGHMRLGHVAVVTAVNGGREIEIEHANWAGPGANKGGISRGIPVVDVSEANDWSSVRVGLGRSGEYGSTYPTYGFIYDRADPGTRLANNAAPSRADQARVSRVSAFDEVAQAKPRRREAGIILDLYGDSPAHAFK